MKHRLPSAEDTQIYGRQLAGTLSGGDVIELVGDVGAGKTTLVKGIAAGLGIDETIQSPSFTISRVYELTDGRRLYHYDFYRLNDPGIMQLELAEATEDPEAIVIVEWADAVRSVLPAKRRRITITIAGETARQLVVERLA